MMWLKNNAEASLWFCSWETAAGGEASLALRSQPASGPGESSPGQTTREVERQQKAGIDAAGQAIEVLGMQAGGSTGMG